MKSILPALLALSAATCVAVAESVWTLPAAPSAEVLEPSILNEVEHALARVPDGAAANGCGTASPPATSVTSVTARVIALVSAQRADGRWLDGTNDVTAAVACELRRLAGLEDAR